MTHLYSIARGGIVIRGTGQPDATALAWAGGTVLALGDEAGVSSISRGDSLVAELRGACVVPLAGGSDAPWPLRGTLEVGGPADFAVVERDPRTTAAQAATAGTPPRPSIGTLAIVRAGRLVSGSFSGIDPSSDHHPHAGVTQ